MNISDACTLAVEGETDKFCEVAEENDLSDDVANPRSLWFCAIAQVGLF